MSSSRQRNGPTKKTKLSKFFNALVMLPFLLGIGSCGKEPPSHTHLLSESVLRLYSVPNAHTKETFKKEAQEAFKKRQSLQSHPLNRSREILREETK